MAIVLALYSIQENNRRWIKEWYRRKWIPQHTHENQDILGSEWAKRQQIYFFCVWFDGPSFDGILKTTIATETLTCEKQWSTVSVYPLRYAIWPREITLKTWNSLGLHLSWKYCLLLGRHGNWMNIAQYCPQTIQHIAQPFNIIPRRSICTIWLTVEGRLMNISVMPALNVSDSQHLACLFLMISFTYKPTSYGHVPTYFPSDVQHASPHPTLPSPTAHIRPLIHSASFLCSISVALKVNSNCL